MIYDQSNCDEFTSRIEAALDDELSLSDKQELEQHLELCDACRSTHESMSVLKNTLRNTLSNRPPVALKNKIRDRIRSLGEDSDHNNRTPGQIMNWLGFGGGVLATVSLSVWLLLLAPVTQQLPGLQTQILYAHIRSLQVDHLSDVASSDRHTVKPWFNGKINFSPPIHDFASKGFILKGGRLDYINEQNVAVAIYKRREHVINLFMWPSTNLAKTTERSQPDQYPGQQSSQKNGYRIIRFSKAGLEYWLVSDLNSKELQLFTALVKNNGLKSTE